MLFTLLIFLIVLSILVFVHELGHFWTARKMGVRAEEFGFGFPPRAWGIYKNVEGKWKQVKGGREVDDAVGTIYSINFIPLGGFVKIKGEDGGDAREKDSFAGKKIWQRAVIISAGVIMNVVLAAALLSFGFMFGLPQPIDENLGSGARVEDKNIRVLEIMLESPAERAGFEVGDTILSINGNNFDNYKSLQGYISSKEGEELNYKLKRDGGEEVEKTLIPEKIKSKEDEYIGVGIAILETGTVSYPWYLALWQGAKTAIIYTGLIITAFISLIIRLFSGQGVGAEIAGPVGIAVLTGEAARMGVVYLSQFAAILSLNLAVINFLPIPALDGGRFLFLIIEKIFGRPVKKEVEGALHYIGFVLMMILIVFITFKDVAKWIG